MAEASGSGECRPSTSKGQPTPVSPADSEIPAMCTCSPEGASGCPQCPRSPPPSAKQPSSNFYRKSPQSEPHSKGKGRGKKSKATNKQKSATSKLKLHKLPRYLWAAFGRVSGPLKRHLRRRNIGQRAKRALPWSKAACVASLFNVQWFEAMVGDDEVGKMMRAITSPRPNRAASRRARLGQLQPAPENAEEAQPQPGPSHSRRELFPDILEEQPRPLSDIMEEEREEQEYMQVQREFVEDYSAPLPANGEFEVVGGQNEEEEGAVVVVGVKRKAENDEEDPSGDAGNNPGQENKEEDEEEEAVVRPPVRRKLF